MDWVTVHVPVDLEINNIHSREIFAFSQIVNKNRPLTLRSRLVHLCVDYDKFV